MALIHHHWKGPLLSIPGPSYFSSSKSVTGLVLRADGAIVTNDLWSEQVLKCRRQMGWTAK